MISVARFLATMLARNFFLTRKRFTLHGAICVVDTTKGKAHLPSS